MSAPAASTGRAVPVGRRSDWRRLLSVTWRQHRLPLVIVAVLFGGFAALLVVQGIGMHAAYQAFGLSYSHPANTARTISFAGTFESEYLGIGMYLPRFLMFLPLVIGRSSAGRSSPASSRPAASASPGPSRSAAPAGRSPSSPSWA